ncbi:hypothetical protein TNCV_2229581 [Trichonephila clavipes]|nr:hypothetical protein TNCV_2229581 [Trichonephila clavipes]
MDWPARSRDLSYRACMGFLERALGSSYLTTSNDSGASIGAARRDGQQCLINSLTPSLSSMGRRCETCPIRGEIISPAKDRIFLAGHHHRGMFWPSVALHSMLLFQSSFFYPSDFSLVNCCLHYTCHTY